MSTAVSTAPAITDPHATPTIPGGSAAATNTVLDDLVDAVNTYPKTHLTVDIFDVNAPGGATNTGDDCTFRVRVNNSGPLNVNDLTVLVEALPGARGVSLHGATALDGSLVSAVFPLVPAHMEVDDWVEAPDDHYHFEAGAANPSAELVKASINDWNADLNHILLGHSDPRKNANDVFIHEVVAS